LAAYSYGGRHLGMKKVGNDRKTLKPLPFSYFFIRNGNSETETISVFRNHRKRKFGTKKHRYPSNPARGSLTLESSSDDSFHPRIEQRRLPSIQKSSSRDLIRWRSFLRRPALQRLPLMVRLPSSVLKAPRRAGGPENRLSV
jgi:hypothetical protein